MSEPCGGGGGGLTDPVFLVSCAAYAAQRWLVLPHLGACAWRSHGADLLLLPAALPVALWLQRRVGVRDAAWPPTPFDILFHWASWSVAAEVLAPAVSPRATGDVLDVVAYGVGAAVAVAAWCWFPGWRSRR